MGLAPTPTTSRLAASVLSTGKSSRLYKRLVYDEQIATDVDASLDAARDRRPLRHRGRRAPGRRSGQGRAGARRGAGPVPRRRPDGGRAAAGQDADARAASSAASSASAGSAGSPTCWPRAQVFAGRPDYYKVQLARDGRRHRGAGPRRGGALARATASTRSRCGRSPTTPPRPPAPTARSCPSPARRPRPKFPALERATLSNGLKIVLAERRVDPAGAIRPAARRRLRVRPVRPARHRQPGDEHARRGHRPPARRSRSATRWRTWAPPSAPASRLDVVERLARGADATSSIRRSTLYADVILHPAFRAGRPRAAPEAAPGADPAREGRPGRHGAAGASRGCSTARATPTRNPWTGTGHRGLDREDHARRPGQVPPDLVQAQQRARWSSSATRRMAEIQPEARAAVRRLDGRATCRRRTSPRSRRRRGRRCTCSTGRARSRP